MAASPNFTFLGHHETLLVRIASAAEHTCLNDPVACLIRLRQLTEMLARHAIAYAGLTFDERGDQLDRLRALEDGGILTREMAALFHGVRQAGNRAVHAYEVSGKCWVNNHAHVLRPLPPLNTDFILFSLMHYPVIPWLSGTTGRAKLTQGAMNTLPLALPPIEELSVIIQRVQKALAVSDSVRPSVIAGYKMLDTFSQSILAKAFRGELVPTEAELARQEGRSYEPASDLLERIQAERNGNKGGVSKKATKREQQVGQLKLNM